MLPLHPFRQKTKVLPITLPKLLTGMKTKLIPMSRLSSMMLLVKRRNLPRFLKKSKVKIKASKVLVKTKKAMLTSQSVPQYGKV